MVIRGWRFVNVVLRRLHSRWNRRMCWNCDKKCSTANDREISIQTRVYGRIHLRGGVYQVVSIIATGVLAFMVRKANDLYFDLDWLFLSIAGVWCLARCSRAGKFGRSRCASFGA